MIVSVRLLFSLCLCNLGILGGEGIGRGSGSHSCRRSRLLLRFFLYSAAAEQHIARYRCSGKNSDSSYTCHDELFLHCFGTFRRVCIIIRNIAGRIWSFFYKILFIWKIRFSMKELLLELLNIKPHHLCFTALSSFAGSSFLGNISTYSRSEYLSRA